MQAVLEFRLVNQHLRTTIGENVSDFRRSETIVDRDRRPAAQFAGGINFHVFRTVLRQHGDPVAPLHAEPSQRIGKAEGSFRQFAVRDRPPLEDDGGR